MKRKLERFRIIKERNNVIEPSKSVYNSIRGKWRSEYFGNDNPITLELACGRGEYSVGLASRFPDRNYIGVDIKGERIWKGSSLAVEHNLANVVFLRTNILALESFFAPGEANEIWLVFPDPHPRNRDIKRRLTSPRFMGIYKMILAPGSYVRLKTDNPVLYAYTLDELSRRNDVREVAFSDDLYGSPLQAECFDILTRYEEMFVAEGERIKYLRFQFP